MPRAYACFHNDVESRLKSASGGVFPLLAELVLRKRGVVFGACFDERFRVVHKGVTTIEDLDLLRGSKYVQSRLGDCFDQIRILLEQKVDVLFSGTPCQVNQLIRFLGQCDSARLMTVDIICHSVPDPIVFEAYKRTLEMHYHDKIKSINFRDKRLGWNPPCVVVQFENHEYIARVPEDFYMRGFLMGLYSLSMCSECPAKFGNSQSDLTLGDFWGIAHVFPEMESEHGVSLVMTHTERGQEYFDKIVPKIVCRETTVEDAAIYNPRLLSSHKPHPNRAAFYKDLHQTSDFFELVERHL